MTNRPRPLRNAALAAGGVSILMIDVYREVVALFVELGLPRRFAEVLVRLGTSIILLAAAKGVQWLGESEVTPVANPQDNDGNRLVAVHDLELIGVPGEVVESVRPPDVG